MPALSYFRSDAFASTSVILLLGGVYIAVSASMIAFNKYLIHEGRFPFAMPLVLLHAGFSSFCALILLLVKPSMFPSLTDPEQKVAIDMSLIVKGALPIAFLFSTQLVLSNSGYLHSSMAFLQMMKESNLVLVYVFSLFLAMESFSWVKVRVICLIVLATMLTIRGELNFSWAGFALQGTSQFFECSKIVLQALLLSSAGRKLDVLTYVVVVMPLCFCVLGLCQLLMMYASPQQIIDFKVPQWSDVVAWWPLLLANASVAFALNLCVALFMKQSSAVGFILAGITKDAVIVMAGALFMRESLSHVQMLGFAFQLLFIWVWSLMKLSPKQFEGGIIEGISLVTTREEVDKGLLAEHGSDKGSSQAYGVAEKLIASGHVNKDHPLSRAECGVPEASMK